MLACDWFKNSHGNAAKVKLQNFSSNKTTVLNNIFKKTFITMWLITTSNLPWQIDVEKTYVDALKESILMRRIQNLLLAKTKLFS